MVAVDDESAPNVCFILANAARDPSSHPFFFSGRFSFEPFLECRGAHEEMLRLALNLTYQRFPCKMAISKLHLLEILERDFAKERDLDNLLLIEKIQRNINVNNT